MKLSELTDESILEWKPEDSNAFDITEAMMQRITFLENKLKLMEAYIDALYMSVYSKNPVR